MTAKKIYDDIINHTFNMLTVTGLAGRRPSGEQLFYCTCSCGTKNHLASKHQLLSNNLQSCGCLRRDNENMNGKVFTRLTVIKRLDERGYKNQHLFLCQCSCKNTIKVIKSKLIHGYTKSCGCLLKEIITKYKDLVGKRFGKLLVVKKAGKLTKRRDIFWECKCDCGNIINITTGNLIHGHNIGCGCVNMDLIKAYRISKGKNPDVPIKTERQLLRSKIKKLKLDKKTFERDKYTCQLCGLFGCYLNAHHIIPIHINELKALDINNMVSLCKKCHFEKAHDKNYKKINNTIQQQLIQKMAR